MRSRGSDMLSANNTRSRSVDRVSNSNVDLSRLTRAENSMSSRFNSLNRVRSSMESGKKPPGSICSTLPSRGRYNNGAVHNNKYNFKADPCYTSNIDHLVYANSTRSSFNVKYGNNFPLSNSMQDRRLLPEEIRKQQMNRARSANNEGFRHPLNKAKSTSYNSSSGASRSFDNNAFQQSPTIIRGNTKASPLQQSVNNRVPSARIKPAASSVNTSPTRQSTSRPQTTKFVQPTKYVSKQQSSIEKGAKDTAVARSRIHQQQSQQSLQCNSPFEEPKMLISGNKITTTTTILQETTPNRRNNVSILQVRSVSEPNPQQPIKHQVNISTIPASATTRSNNGRNLLLPPTQTRATPSSSSGSSIPVYKYQSNAANLWRSAAGKIVTCAASNKAKLAAAEQQNNSSGNTREMSPVRWCDEEVAGVYLGRSGWVQVCAGSNQQRSVTKANSTDSNLSVRPDTLNLLKPQDNGMPSQQQQYSRSVSAPVEPEPLLLSDDENMLSLNTPIISPPLAFQDERENSRHNRSKLLPRSNAFDFPDPDEVTKAFLQSTSPTKKQTPSPSKARSKLSSEDSSSSGSFRTAASSGGMRSVTPSWRGGSGGGRMSCGDSCSSSSSSPSPQGRHRARSSSEESLSFMAGAALSPDATPKRHQPRHNSHSGWRHNGVLHLSDTNADRSRRPQGSGVNARKTVTSPESSTSSASTSPARHPSRSRPSAPKPHSTPKSRFGAARCNTQMAAPRYVSSQGPQVTRSTSLQLPTATVHGRARQREPTQNNRTSKTHSVDEMPPKLGWHQAELRAVTDYLSSTRSRNAARALLLQRYLNQQGISPDLDNDLVPEILEPTEPSGRHSSASYNVVYMDKSRYGDEKSRYSDDKSRYSDDKSRYSDDKSSIRHGDDNGERSWKRDANILEGEEQLLQSRSKYEQCCNPATCDFWPECEHQNLHSNNKKSENRKPYLCQMRSSLSYPSPCSNNDNMTQSAYQQSQSKRRDRCITAPCSLDRVDEDPHVKTITIPKRDIYREQTEPCSPVEKNGFRNSSSDDLSTSADDLDERKPKSVQHLDKPSESEMKSPNSLSPNSGTSRPHSADCLLRRRQLNGKTNDDGAEAKANSERNSPIVEETPKAQEGQGAQQRSLSLPKSFMSKRQPARPKMPAEFSWQQEEKRGGTELVVPAQSYPNTALSTPTTPGHATHKTASGNDTSCFGTSSSKERLSDHQQQSSSSGNFLASALRHTGLAQTQECSKRRRSSADQLSVLQKFKRSFAQRFTRSKSRSRDMVEPHEDSSPIIHDLLEQQQQLDTDSYFKRIGPMWRQKDNNGTTAKSCRNSKCSSGDSGYHMEDALKSLETESQDLSPELQRRSKSPDQSNKKTRPLSEVLNETFLEKYKLEETSEVTTRGPQVRRTHSDLGGSPQLNSRDVTRGRFTRQVSSPNPLKLRPGLSADLGMNSASEEEENVVASQQIASAVVIRRTSAASTDSNASVVCVTPIQRQQQLRRSISQPMGINELSPLLRRRPSGNSAGVPSVVPRRVSRGRRVRRNRRNKTGSGAAGACSEDELQRSSDYDEDDETDSECSSASDLSRKHSFDIRPLAQVVLAEAVWDHVTLDSEELAFQAGTLIEVVDCTTDKDWWFGHIGTVKGWFPAAFVRFRVSQDDTLEDCLSSMVSAAKSPSPSERIPSSSPLSGEQPSKQHKRTRSSTSHLSNDQVRASVVREILSTERDFVRNLTDVVQGYLWECRRREDLFTSQQLINIFGNIEELLDFQASFLAALETRVNLDDPISSCLGHTFLDHTSGFHVYSEYCNGHHIAQATLQELCSQPGYRQFFEACRLVRGLINISLDGFLLTPVQRICKYPLQLGELLKYTRTDHPDYEDVRNALEAMRAVATLVNERKRRMESLEKLAAWQQRVEGWEGEDLIDLSSQLIHQGEAVRVTSGRWSSNVKLFLFDRQLLYCKRDLLRRGLFVYKGRIALDHCQIIDVPDGKDVHLGISVRHGIKLVSRSGPSGRPPVSRGAVQWLLLCFRSAEEKRIWLHALSEERALVSAEQARGLQLEPSAREIARLLTSRHTTSRPSMKPRAKGHSKRRAREALVPHLATSETSLGGASYGENSLGRKVGHWFTFSSKSKQHRRGTTPSSGGSLQQLLPH